MDEIFSSWVESPSLFDQEKGKKKETWKGGITGKRKEVQGVSNEEDLTHMDEK
jgi:hypothetical protein